ncbi:MAG TPA: 23S rRNA (adenine(2503)-C(2))-methyltransferase RlmN [Planctomycetota bacterium]|jgi:23S rRNA (adenine2503-C2)-methyltransferase|nr:23S rRNA (adenine(2503)-C(2))-methyltransferase RlmN [Planctomycetota bacterium]
MSPAAGPPSVLELDAAPLERTVLEAGGRRFHADSIRAWVLRRGARTFGEMTDLPRDVADRLARALSPLSSTVGERRVAPDGTARLLVSLRDGNAIETVVLPGRAGATLCVSTQVGCPVGCRFCASGLSGVVRNLTAAEIVEQFLHGRTEAASGGASRPVARAVVMGIGEPTLNLEALLAALDLVTGPGGFGLGARRITISTVGYPDRVRRLAAKGKPYNLAVSLHAPDDATRAALIPAMARVPLAAILEAARDYFEKTGREPTFEYVLLAGTNDAPEQARALARLLEGTRGTVNLIPYNPVPESPFRRPARLDVEAFARILRAHGIPATIRWSKGLEADAACGQLRIDRAPPAR